MKLRSFKGVVMPKFHTRTFIGAALFAAILVLLVTSILMYSQQHHTGVAITHTMVGFVMLIVLFWHLAKNKVSLFKYLNPFTKHGSSKSIAMPIASIIIGYLIYAGLTGAAPARLVYMFGQTLKATDEGEKDKEHKYVERVILPEGAKGQTITLELKKGDYFLWPQYAFWLETLDGEFVQPLYVTEKIATNEFTNKVAKVDPDQVFNTHLLIGEGANARTSLTGGLDPETKDTRMRPESLPVFLHQLGVQTESGLYLPTDDKLLVDGFTGATMIDNFVYSIQLPERLTGQYRIRFEVNHSFDYNEFYSSDRFPDDPIYSGDGFTAQPSVIYQGLIDFDKASEELVNMSVIGRGHHSGRDGQIYDDLDNLTTALELVDRILISHSKG